MIRDRRWEEDGKYVAERDVYAKESGRYKVVDVRRVEHTVYEAIEGLCKRRKRMWVDGNRIVHEYGIEPKDWKNGTGRRVRCEYYDGVDVDVEIGKRKQRRWLNV